MAPTTLNRPTQHQKIAKRIFDVSFSLIGLTFTMPLIVGGWVAATVSCRQNGFFLQTRIGLGGRPFRVIKLRTMIQSEADNSHVTTENDPRITRVGRFLRKSKLDELPQLFNVLFGTMSFVGPRPDVPGFADKLEGEDRIILSVRPGITGPATLAFRKEENLLANKSDPATYNREVVWPEKVRLNKLYIAEYSLARDVAIIWETLFPKRSRDVSA